MKPQDLRRMEERARKLEAGQAARNQRRDRAAATPPPSPRNPDGFAAMLTIFTGLPLDSVVALGFLSLVLLLVGGMALLPGSDGEALVLGLLFGGMGLVHPAVMLLALAQFFRFRRWRTRLPYQLLGDWERIMDNRDGDTWFPCTLEVHVEPALVPAVNALLRIYCVEANTMHFRPDSGSLEAWTARETTARGDVGGRVAWRLYRLLSADLPALGRDGVTVKSVRLTAGKPHTVRAAHDPMS